ncbi:multicopper oxidase [Viridothelium virens]|uniref:Multicopper oxidase n=1 Tax=Viridothelium virens TaxID=1048519 RepID=A0A6A6GZM4_VIRVR|nr:multicopper oxidase [Viridothelium virens]
MPSRHEDEPEDGYELDSGSSQLTPSEEQEQALLSEHDVEKLPQQRAREHPISLITRILRPRTIVPIIIGSILAIIALAIALKQVRTPGDYTLNPNWDYGVGPKRRVYNWTIQDIEKNPDGVYRPMMLVNGQFPGPLIECNEGDTIVVNVDNQAANATSIHWHGLYQNGTNWMDGTVGITQCPIAPNTRFTYDFKVDGQSGTYWYHAHQGVQAADGLFGPFVIHGKDEREQQKIEYHTDRVVMVHDHYYNLSSELLMEYLAPDQENAEPVPDSALINGMNVRDCSSLLHRKCDNSSASLPVFALESTKNHRLRIINVGAFAEFQLQIDEHEFAVTEVDGTDIWPAYYHRLKINPAQRYSIIISSNSTNSYWLRAQMITTCFAEPNPDMKGEARAIINYTTNPTEPSSPSPEPTSKDWNDVVELECRDMNTTELIPIEQIPPPSVADATFYLRTTFEIGAWRLSRGFFNQTSWRASAHSPTLLRAVDGLSSSNTSFISSGPSSTTSTSSLPEDILPNPFAFVNTAAFDATRELVLQTSGIRTVDLLVSNFDDGAHPLHLHGHKFWVLASGSSGYPSPSIYEDGTLNLENPLRRDTVTMEAFGWVLVRVVLDNPGMWALHCHVTWHAEAGLMMQVLARAEEVAKFEIPADVRGLCGKEGLERGMAPSDEIFMHQPDQPS